MSSERPVVIDGIRYKRAPVPVHFPVEETVPETKRHLEQRTLLYEILKLAFAHRAAIGCDQFVYWNPTDPRQCLAPDAFVRLAVPDSPFDSWKAWERGAPELAVGDHQSIRRARPQLAQEARELPAARRARVGALRGRRGF
ncbi:MAG: hypothetical protein QM756_28445 [Polyangiaceae bacterium]